MTDELERRQLLEDEIELEVERTMRGWPAFCTDPKNASLMRALHDSARALSIADSMHELLRPRVYRQE